MASLSILTSDHEGCPIKFDKWLDDLQLYLLSDSRDSVSLFDHTSGASLAPPDTADSVTRSQWLTLDAAARLDFRNHMPLAERAHFGQHKIAKALYDAVVVRYSSPATATLGHLILPYLFPELSAFATVDDLITHLRTSDARNRAALTAKFLDKNPPPMDHFLALEPTDLSVDLLEKHLLAAETSIVVVGAARGTPRTPFFEGCSPSPLAPSYASAAAVHILGTEDVGAASAPSWKRRSGKGKGGKSGGGGSGGGDGGGSGGGGGGGGGGGSGGGSGGFGGGGGGSGGSGGGGGGGSGSGGGGSGGGRGGAVQRGGSGGGQRQQQQRPSKTPTPQQLRDRAGQTCGKFHTQHRCFSRLDDAWRAEFGDEAECPSCLELLRSGVDIFALDYDAILAAMYALTVSAEGDCYLCVPEDLRVPRHDSLAGGSLSHRGSCASGLLREHALGVALQELEALPLEALELEVLELLVLEVLELLLELEVPEVLELLVLEVLVLEVLELPELVVLEALELEALDLDALELETIELKALELETLELEVLLLEELELEELELETLDWRRWRGGDGDRGAGAGGTGAGGARAGGACAGGARAGGAGAEGTGAGGTGAGDPGAGGACAGDSPQPAPSPYPKQTDSLTERREPASRPASPVHVLRTGRRVPCPRPPPVPGTHIIALRPSSVPVRVPLPSPPASSLADGPDLESDLFCAASPTVTRLLAIVVTDPSFESAAASALVAALVDFAAACRLDYAASLVAKSESGGPPSVGGECALGTDVLEDRQEDFECLVAATAMDAEMASWKSTGTYVNGVPPPGSNIVDGMWIFRVKRPPSSPPVFKARYVARGSSQRQGHSFLIGQPHDEIWLRRPPGFTGWFPAGTEWSLRWPVYGLRQAPHEWHDTLRTTLAALGFAPSIADPSLFLHTDTWPCAYLASLAHYVTLLLALLFLDWSCDPLFSPTLPMGERKEGQGPEVHSLEGRAAAAAAAAAAADPASTAAAAAAAVPHAAAAVAAAAAGPTAATPASPAPTALAPRAQAGEGLVDGCHSGGETQWAL
ncbi:unnamed protein product [Closterium sp. NIES-53]